MGLLDWARALIERNMQSAADRDAWWASYVRGVDTARRDIKDQWAAPTKGAGSWTSETATARFESRHDAALKALRRPRIDDE